MANFVCGRKFVVTIDVGICEFEGMKADSAYRVREVESLQAGGGRTNEWGVRGG